MQKILVIFVVFLTSIFSIQNHNTFAARSNDHQIMFLSIGVNNKASPEYDDYAEENKLFEKHIENYSLYQVNKKTILGTNATCKNCKEGFDWLIKNNDKNNLNLIYIGAHGNYVNNGGYYFCTFDGYFWGKEIAALIKKLNNVILIIDTCHSGAIIEYCLNCADSLIIAACGKNEFAYSYNFTPQFKNAVRGGDYDANGLIDTEELIYYISMNLTKQTLTCYGNNNKMNLMRSAS